VCADKAKRLSGNWFFLLSQVAKIFWQVQQTFDNATTLEQQALALMAINSKLSWP